jgi:hypothetical protein
MDAIAGHSTPDIRVQASLIACPDTRRLQSLQAPVSLRHYMTPYSVEGRHPDHGTSNPVEIRSEVTESVIF